MQALVIAVLAGILIAFIAALPVGAVNVAIVSATLNKTRRAAFLIGAGAILVETFYCAIPLLGFGYILNGESIVFHILYLPSIPLLLGMGIYTIINRKRAAIDGVRNRHLKSTGNEFLFGATLCASNPMVLIFWAQITVLITKLGIINNELNVLIAFLSAVPFGTFILYYLIIAIAHKQKQRVSLRIRAKINLAVGIIFIVISAYLSVYYIYNYTDF